MDYATEFKTGNFRTGENYWMYAGLLSFALAGILIASMCGWKLDGHMLERALPGSYLDGEEMFLTVAGCDLSLKIIEYGALMLTTMVGGVSYVMGTK